VEDLSQKTMIQTRGIVAFEIEITEVQATKKLSQNRDDFHYKDIISELEKRGGNKSVTLANKMKKCPQ
jgi:transcriptional regulator